MKRIQHRIPTTLFPALLSAFLLLSVASSAALSAQPEVGEKAPDFALQTVQGKTVRLSEMTPSGTVVLAVLRGYPGYQCPFCNRQVQDFLKSAEAFGKAGAQVVLVYPGPPQDLTMKAQEFLGDKTMPENFHLLLDPGYEFTNLYGLRWEAERETAYPSTFLIDRTGTVFFSKVVKSHGGRTSAAEILDALPRPRPARK